MAVVVFHAGGIVPCEDSAATLFHRAATLPQAHSLTAPKGRNTLSAPPVPTRCRGLAECVKKCTISTSDRPRGGSHGRQQPQGPERSGRRKLGPVPRVRPPDAGRRAARVLCRPL